MDAAAATASYDAPCVVLGKQRQWWVFLLSSVCTPFVLTFLVILARICILIDYKLKHRANKVHIAYSANGFKTSEIEVPLNSAIRDAADNFVSLRFRVGQIMAFLAFTFSMCSLFIYYNNVSFYLSDVEHCKPWVLNIGQQVDFAFNMFFLLYFILRFLATDSKIAMLFNLYSIIDYFTVAPAFVGIALDRDWIGLKFLRVIYLRRISTIVGTWDLMTSVAKIKLLQLGLTWIAILLAAGGLFHLVENSGDPFFDDYDGQRITYWDFCYFAFLTMSTLGSADVNMKTILGKLTNCFLVLIVLVVIAVAVPEVFTLMGKRSKYNGEHRKIHNEKHIVLCGEITPQSVFEIFSDFFHPDRDTRNIKIIVLSMFEPDLDFARFIKKNMFQIGYLQGSLLNSQDLFRAKVHEANACLVLANKSTADAEAEDSSNIMRVVALKNYHPPIRVIVQLLQYRSKSYLTSIPNWNPSQGDDAICLPEIKLGLLAQSCTAPGFSTLMANMFAARSCPRSNKYTEWMNNYLAGAGMEMYTEKFGPAFAGLTVLQAVELCYTKLNLLLFAISLEPLGEDTFFSQKFVFNPPSNIVLDVGLCGCFIADSAKDVQKITYYCKNCHEHIEDPTYIKPCDCEKSCRLEVIPTTFGERLRKTFKFKKTSSTRRLIKRDKTAKDPRSIATTVFSNMARKKSRNAASATSLSLDNQSAENLFPLTSFLNSSGRQSRAELKRDFTSFQQKMVYFMRNYGSIKNWKNDNGEIILDEYGDMLDFTGGPRFDSTGLFWWCPPQTYEELLIDRFEAAKRNFKHHVVLIIFANESASVMGLNNFVMPLRSSHNTYDQLTDIVIVGDARFLRMEWEYLASFPKIHMVPVKELSRAVLRAVNVHLADLCLLLTASSCQSHNTLLSDKDPILTSLSIKAMNFGFTEDLAAQTDGNNNTNSQTMGLEELYDEAAALRSSREAVAAALLRKTATFTSKTFQYESQNTIRGYTVPLLAEILSDQNVQFVDLDDEDLNKDFFMAEPFACGNTFAISVLQSLMVSTYFNPFTLSVLRSLIFGGFNPEFEMILDEGSGLIGGPNLSQKNPFADRCILGQISVQDGRFARFSDQAYGELFLDALRNFNIICLGIFRRLAPEAQGARSLKRYVITNPPKDLKLLMDDRIFIIERPQSSREKGE